jgi:leucyl/phenylalanyl-tRNA--protein transferase
MFHRERDASKVALLGLCRMLDDQLAERRLIDTQWVTPHLASLGVVEISRREYLARLATALRLPSPSFPGTPRRAAEPADGAGWEVAHDPIHDGGTGT